MRENTDSLPSHLAKQSGSRPGFPGNKDGSRAARPERERAEEGGAPRTPTSAQVGGSGLAGPCACVLGMLAVSSLWSVCIGGGNYGVWRRGSSGALHPGSIVFHL